MAKLPTTPDEAPFIFFACMRAIPESGPSNTHQINWPALMDCNHQALEKFRRARACIVESTYCFGSQTAVYSMWVCRSMGHRTIAAKIVGQARI